MDSTRYPLCRSIKRVIARVDDSLGCAFGRRVVFDLRNDMNVAVLQPMISTLRRDPRIRICFSSEEPAKVFAAVRREFAPSNVLQHSNVQWRRWDLYVSADPWTRPRLRRCAHAVNFFHGVAGKGNLDDPSSLPIGFDWFDKVAFINRERMETYVSRGLVTTAAAVLVGFPKLDRLVLGRYDIAAVRQRLGLTFRPTVLYSPTWSPASSLHVAGEQIVANLAEYGFNVIVKLHALSLDSLPKHSGGVDWQTRMRRLESPGRVAYVEDADIGPLMALSDALVTDHSTVGFEYCVLDRPIVVFNAPDLARVAKINPVQIERLRSVSRVVRAAAEVGPAVKDELLVSHRRSAERAALAARMFYQPGSATQRAIRILYDLLRLEMPESLSCIADGAATAVAVATAPDASRDAAPAECLWISDSGH